MEEVSHRYTSLLGYRIGSDNTTRFCLEIQLDENDALACVTDDLESGKVQIYEAYLEWVLRLGGIQCEDSLITNWYYIRMLHRDKNQERDIGPVIGKHMSNVSFPSAWFNSSNRLLTIVIAYKAAYC